MLGGQLFQLPLSAAAFFIVARFLEASQLGPWIAIVALNGILGPLSDLSFSSLLLRNSARNPADFPRIWGQTLLVFGLGSVLVTAAVCVLGDLIIRPASVWPLLGAVSVADLILRRFVNLMASAYQALDQYGRLAAVSTIPPLLAFAAALTWAYGLGDRTLPGWIAFYCAAALISALLAALLAVRHLPAPDFSRRPSRQEFRDALWFLLSPGTNSLNNDADKLILSHIAPAAEVGCYGLAYRIVLVALLPVMARRTSRTMEYFRAGSLGIAKANAMAIAGLPVNILLGAAIGAALFASASLLPWLFGEQYGAVVPMLRLLALLPVLKAVQMLFASVLSGSDNQQVRVFVQSAAMAANIGLCLVLIPPFGWRGAAYASLAADGLLAALLIGAVRFCLRRERAGFTARP